MFFKKNFKYFIMSLALLTVLMALGYLSAPNRFVNFFRFFPRYNPFSRNIEQDIKNVGEKKEEKDILTSSELRKTLLSLNNGSKRSVIIYLPQGYNLNEKRIYPTIYMLHGSPGLPTDCILAGNAKVSLDYAITYKVLPPTIAVFPDGNGGANRDTQFINSADGSERNEDFLVKTVVDFVDTHFLTLKDPAFRAIGGVSSGGFGSINLALKHPEVFGNVLSFSGYGRIEKNLISNLLIKDSESLIHDNSPLDYIRNLKSARVNFFLFIGDNDDLLDQNRQLEQELSRKGFPVTLRLAKGGHEWQLWHDYLPEGLLWLGGIFQTVGKTGVALPLGETENS